MRGITTARDRGLQRSTARVLVAVSAVLAVATVAAAWSAAGHSAAAATVVVAGLAALQLLVVVLLTRRVQADQRTELTLRSAVRAAGARERRRIAHEVHTDVLPALEGVLQQLDVAAQTAPDGAGPLPGRSAEGLRGGIRRLRALLLDLDPDLPEGSLAAALAELARRVEATGIRVSVDAPGIGRLQRPTAEVLYRCVQETLRNVAAHSGAEQVEITVRIDGTAPDGGAVTMTVDDDGRGFEGSRIEESRAEGHVGLPALGELVADRGGSLTASSAPGQGTRVVVQLPVRQVGEDMRVRS